MDTRNPGAGAAATAPVTPCDPSVTPTEAPRLSRQCQAILDLFRLDPFQRATNTQLAALALKYTSRLSDLRAAGYTVNVWSRDHETGVVVYELVEA